MVIEIRLFLKDQLLTAFVNSDNAHSFYHPETNEPIVHLEPSSSCWNVFAPDGEKIGKLYMDGFRSIREDLSFYLTVQKADCDHYHFYAMRSMMIGRSEQCDLIIQDPYVSYRHCRIYQENDCWLLIDQQSTNGTYINGRRIKEHTLSSGDVVVIGKLSLVIGTDFFASKCKLLFEEIEIPSCCKGAMAQRKSIIWMESKFKRGIVSFPKYKEPSISSSALLFQLGPGISMAACSLLAMQATSVNVWMQINIVSNMIFWPSLIALIDFRRKGKKKKKARTDYQKNLLQFDKHLQQRLQEQNKLQQLWKQQLCKRDVCIRGERGMLYLGEGMQMPFEISDLNEDISDPLCLHTYDKLKQKWLQAIDDSVVIESANLIWIIGEDPYTYALFVLMQLLKQCEGKCRLFVIGFEDLTLFGRLRFLYSFQHDRFFAGEEVEREAFLQKVQKKAKDETWITICEQSCFDPIVSQGENIFCIVPAKDRTYMDQRGIVADLQEKRYWNGGWQMFVPYRYTLDQWNDFCVFMTVKKRDAQTMPGDFLSLFSCNNIEKLPVHQAWEKQKENTLAVVIGWDGNGELISLDAHEKADGPHGIVAGTTGSGKSELLLTYILSLSCQYPPDQVNFFLIDYKGGAMVKAVEDLPHLCGSMTNLEPASLRRVRISLDQELKLRQTCFREMMKRHELSTMSIELYARYRQAGDPVFAHLFLIIDEFAQLRQEHGEFLDDLQRIARIGRSLGIHLLLCTQKPGGIIDDQIWSNARFHLCLRVQDAMDSQEILHRKEAVHLRKSGEFLLQVGDDERFIHGYGAFVNADYCPSQFYRPNQEHHLRMFDLQGKELHHQTWRTWQSSEKQLTILCRYLKSLADGQYQVRRVCMEDLESYRAHRPKITKLQIGWIDQPHHQRIIPFMIMHSLAVFTASIRHARYFLDGCLQAFQEAGNAACYHIGDGDQQFHLHDQKEIRILLFYLEHEAKNSVIMVESLGPWKEYPKLFEHLCSLSSRHQLIIAFQQYDYRFLSSLPASFTKASFGAVNPSDLQEWFSERELPYSLHEEGGILSQNGLFSFLCRKQRKKIFYQRPIGWKDSIGWKSIGVDENENLFFWSPECVTIILYGDQAKEERIVQQVKRWQMNSQSEQNQQTIIGWAAKEEIRTQAQKHRFDGMICWIGEGLEEYAFLFGFHTTSCKGDEMIVRVRATEKKIRLWEGETDDRYSFGSNMDADIFRTV